MGLKSSAISTSGFAVWIQCDDCEAQGPRVKDGTRSNAPQRARRLAQKEGFVPYQGGRTWVCPACRIRRLPYHLKVRLPVLCVKFDVPHPAMAPGPKPRNRRRRPSESEG